ncbi:hypothetical protein A2U01_0014281 [Trifolium medium]|uniref:Uncharacterized protein n=1 Tax=Trifolium medium TaxID=97028 RepID=A0A392N170_9FABA|nr:hypothetical protein [Trifolium medium]
MPQNNDLLSWIWSQLRNNVHQLMKHYYEVNETDDSHTVCLYLEMSIIFVNGDFCWDCPVWESEDGKFFPLGTWMKEKFPLREIRG